MHSLGCRYSNGEGVERDAHECRRWWERAAAKGHAHAMANIGALYQQGAGVEPDLDEARRWYARAAAADQGASADVLEADVRRRIDAARTAARNRP